MSNEKFSHHRGRGGVSFDNRNETRRASTIDVPTAWPFRRALRALCGSALCFCSLALLTACTTPTVIGGDVFELQRNAVLAYESGQDARAEALYQGLARAAPNDPETWLRLGNLYARSSKPDDAADAYQHAILLNPNDQRPWYNLGVIRQRQAHAALIQANQLSDKDDPLYAKTATLIERLAPSPPPPMATEQNHDAAAK
jgi:cytochrome c-type biogenesis protein CcmH/NrfG